MKQPLTEHQEAWLQALESGNYEQGDGFLKKELNGAMKYCCLGVWAEMCLGDGNSVIDEDGIKVFSYANSNGTLATDLWVKLGLYNDIGSFQGKFLVDGDREFGTLTGANDHGVSFKEIAQFCRENPEAVFKPVE